MVSAGRSTRECHAQIAVAVRGEPGMADTGSAAVVLEAGARAAARRYAGRGHGPGRGVAMTGEGGPDR